MGLRLEEIEAEAAEIRRQVQARWDRRMRIAQAVAEARAKHAAIVPAGLGPLLEKAGLTVGDLQQFYDAQQAHAEGLSEAIRPVLQLTPEEIEQIEDQLRAMLITDLCKSPGLPSPLWVPAYLAVSCQAFRSHKQEEVCVCSCDPSPGRNRCHARVRSTGRAFVEDWTETWVAALTSCLFVIPARPCAANLRVEVTMSLHGSYFVHPGLGGDAGIALDVEAEATQHGAWQNENTQRALGVIGEAAGRCDDTYVLEFSIAAEAKPVWVEVQAFLQAAATGAGGVAELDFATGKGNFIDTVWVNTVAQ